MRLLRGALFERRRRGHGNGSWSRHLAMRAHGLRLFAIDVVIWAVVIGLLGGMTYLIALIF